MTRQYVTKVVADLEVKAMLFDMDIDWETLSLMPHSTYQQPFWLKKWKAKESGKDYTVIDYGF